MNDSSFPKKSCPWVKFELFAHPKADVQTLPKDSSLAILTLYQGKVGNIISHDECKHQEWDPINHKPYKLPPLKTNTIWQKVDSETKDLSNVEKIQNYKTTIHLNPNLSEKEKEDLLNQASTQKFRRQVVYNSKKEIKQDFDLSSLILNKYTSIVQFKNGLDDKKQTVYISMFSKNLIQRINQENYLTFFCDATFKLAMNLQVMILGTRLQIPIVDVTKEPKELEYEFVSFAILLTNRKTQVIYEKWF